MKFATWKTIKLGTGFRTSDDFRKALKNANCQIGMGYRKEVNAMFNSPLFKLAPQKTDVRLVNISVSELGFDGASFKEIYSRAQELGLSICSTEVGPQLRLQYPDQPDTQNRPLIIGMKPIVIDPEEWPRGGCVFALDSSEDGLYLCSLKWEATYYQGHSTRFVFVQQE